MALIPYGLARTLLFTLNAETAHECMLALLARGAGTPLAAAWRQARVQDPITLAGLVFPNRVGLAAGMDKNARAIDAWGEMGFGFVEVGTVTPLAQSGNPRPRIFRLPARQAIINRMGFNNEGLDAFVHHVQNSCFYSESDNQDKRQRMILGLNIGKNAATPMTHATDDYLTCLAGVYPHADYVAVNISSPNTQNLRDLQSDAALHALLSALKSRQAELAEQHGKHVPLFLKIAPDLQDEQVLAIADALRTHGIEGVVATNTTLAREAVQGLPNAQQAGGLSGAPVFEASNRVIRQLRTALGAGFPIIGSGGILSGADAVAKIEAGADVVQLYTGLIYQGPPLVGQVARAVADIAPRG